MRVVARQRGSQALHAAAAGCRRSRPSRRVACLGAGLSSMRSRIWWRGTATVRPTLRCTPAAALCLSCVAAMAGCCRGSAPARRPSPCPRAGSICSLKRNTHAIVPETRFRLLQGEGSLSCYQVGLRRGTLPSPAAALAELRVPSCRSAAPTRAHPSQRSPVPEIAKQPVLCPGRPQFNTQTAKHLFCKTCGICPFYRPRSNPDGFAGEARMGCTARRSRTPPPACLPSLLCALSPGRPSCLWLSHPTPPSGPLCPASHGALHHVAHGQDAHHQVDPWQQLGGGGGGKRHPEPQQGVTLTRAAPLCCSADLVWRSISVPSGGFSTFQLSRQQAVISTKCTTRATRKTALHTGSVERNTRGAQLRQAANSSRGAAAASRAAPPLLTSPSAAAYSSRSGRTEVALASDVDGCCLAAADGAPAAGGGASVSWPPALRLARYLASARVSDAHRRSTCLSRFCSWPCVQWVVGKAKL